MAGPASSLTICTRCEYRSISFGWTQAETSSRSPPTHRRAKPMQQPAQLTAARKRPSLFWSSPEEWPQSTAFGWARLWSFSSMDQEQLKLLLEQVRAGAVDPDAALERLRHLPFEDLGYAKVDHHRSLRHGMPEVIFGKGKTPEQVAGIAGKLLERSRNILITRADTAIFARIKESVPEAEYFPLSGAIRLWGDRAIKGKGLISVVCAGTSDIPVAEEAQITAEVMGNEVDAIHDIGVAGIHRLMSNRERLFRARVIVVCAGMEG